MAGLISGDESIRPSGRGMRPDPINNFRRGSLQRQLDEFREHYNERRPTSRLTARPRTDLPRDPQSPPRHQGRMTLRRAGRMHHLGIGTAHAGKRFLALADEHHITVADLDTG